MKNIIKSKKNIKKYSLNFYYYYKKCKLIKMKREYPVSDIELNALFLGLVKIIKQKIEYENVHQCCDLNNYEKLMILYKNKIKECNKLKNEKILLLKQIEKK